VSDTKRMNKAQLLAEIEQLRARVAELEEEHSRQLDARKSLELQALILDQISDFVTVTDLGGRSSYGN